MERHPHGIVYFTDWTHRGQKAVTRPLNLMVLTSVRDTGTEDCNGSVIATPEGPRYMEGVIERLVRETAPAGALTGLVRFVGVITDDTERDMRASDYGVLPEAGRRWLHPLELTTHEGVRVADMTVNIPSAFRALPLSALEARTRAKSVFEVAVAEAMKRNGADILLSDHYMAKLEFLFGPMGYNGRVLNIHPAVTLPGHPFCFRGKTPTADAIARARSGTPTRTGATLHIVNERIDDGPPIALIADTPVYAADEPQHLRYRNYRIAKLPLLGAGLTHYALHVYPHLAAGVLERMGANARAAAR